MSKSRSAAGKRPRSGAHEGKHMVVKVGQKKQIKVGKATFTGKILSVEGDRVWVEYIAPNGEIREVPRKIDLLQ